MENSVITVANLWKKYSLRQSLPYQNLRDNFVNIIKEPYNIFHKNKGRKDGLGDNEFWALKDISFELNKGKILGIIGKNGAGKSTLLKILTRITPPSRGEVRLQGRVASLLEIGTGFQHELTGRENIFLNGAILGMKQAEIKNKFDEIVEFAEIGKFLDTTVKHYSSGMYMRLAFSIAAHLNSEILIIDEVLAVGDISFQKKCLGKINDAAQSGRTVLFVSHNLGAINRLCDSAILLHEGKILATGDTDDVIAKYINSYISNSNKNEFMAVENKAKDLQILRAALVSKNGEIINSIDLFGEAFLEIDYIVRKNLHQTNLSFFIQKDGDVVFRSFDIDQRPDLFNDRKKGYHKAKIKLPQGLLPPGFYTISITTETMTSLKDQEKLDDVLYFKVDSNTTNIANTSFSRKAMVITNLYWEIKEVKTLQQKRI